MATAQKEMTRIEELFSKGKNLTFAEKLELSKLLSEEAEDDKEAHLQQIITDIKNFILSKDVTVEEILPHLQEKEIVFFNVPYVNDAGENKIYQWAVGKKAVGLSAKYYNKLLLADLETKKGWATSEGLEWLETEAGKQWLTTKPKQPKK